MRILLALIAVATAVPAWADPCSPIAQGQAQPGMAAWNVDDCGGLKVVRLAGTPEERASRYGELMKNGQLGRALIDFFLETPERVAQQLPAVVRLFSGLIINGLSAWNDIRIPDPLKKEVDLIADQIGVSRGAFERGTTVPDLGGIGAGLTLKSDVELPLFGCTSVARKLPDGGFAVGRNLDYSGQGVWDTNPQLTIHLPPPGSRELRHAALAADGVNYGSITGFNEAGIALFLHEAFYKAYLHKTGEPVYYIGEQVLREARSLDEAIALLEKHRPIPMWIFILSDLKTGEVAVVESSSTTFYVRRMEGGLLAQANTLRDPKAVPRQVLPWSIFWHSNNREALAAASVTSATNLPELVEAVRGALEKQLDPTGNLSTPGSVLNPETIQSLVISSQADDWQASIGVGLSPVSSGPAVTLKIQNLWNSEAPLEYKPVAQRVSQEVRERHLRLSHAYALTQAGATPAELAAVLAPDPSAPAHLARAIYAYQDRRFDLAASETAGGLAVYSSAGGPASFSETLVRDNLTFVSILSDWSRLGQAPSPVRWQELAATSDPRIKYWVEKLKGKRGKAPSLEIGYQFFTGMLKLPAS